MAQKMLHVCFRVMDRQKSLDFYTKLFDFEIVRENNNPEYKFDLIYLEVPGGDFQLELTYNYDQEEPYVIGDGFSHIALGVDDVAATHKRCLESGYETTEMKRLPDGSTSYFFVTDPDGYRLEVMPVTY